MPTKLPPLTPLPHTSGPSIDESLYFKDHVSAMCAALSGNAVICALHEIPDIKLSVYNPGLYFPVVVDAPKEMKLHYDIKRNQILSKFIDSKPLTAAQNSVFNNYLVIDHPSFGRPVSLSYTFAYGYPPHIMHLSDGLEPCYLFPVGHIEAFAPLYDTVVFNVGLHHLSMEEEAVIEYRATVTDLMGIAQSQPNGFMLETISQHFCEEDGSFEMTFLATFGKSLVVQKNRNKDCTGPHSMDAWKSTGNWRNNALAEIAKSKAFNNVIKVAEYFVHTIGGKYRKGDGDCSHVSKEKMGGHSGVLAKWLEVLGKEYL
ncbi:hypothetical protein TL16_g10906 [Triparma laevis f. inornata]|uniref:Uncharacterized protein n=1 Tax=Triparma laevis f. inornata TaxID=1714386 RepID=A0A9W7ENW9_9STRA|nr:hypothetical protein TL16_g10906 [Triparma laevis f. inornata]